MRITDPGIETDHSQGPVNVNAMMSQIRGGKTANTDAVTDAKPNWEKPTGTPAWEQAEKKATGTSQSAILKSMLNGLKKSGE
jgi:hypothetical protein